MLQRLLQRRLATDGFSRPFVSLWTATGAVTWILAEAVRDGSRRPSRGHEGPRGAISARGGI